VELKSVLGRKDVFALAFGAIIGWGWVILSGPMILRAGTVGSMVAYLAGAVLVGFVGLTYAELTSALPRAGGALGFTYRGLGPGWSWICGWSLAVAYAGVCAFEASAMAMVVNYLFPGFKRGLLYSVAGSEVYATWVATGVACALVIGFINWRGIKSSALLQWLATAGLLLIGLWFFAGSNLFGSRANLVPYFTDYAGVLGVVIMTPFMMTGFDIIPQASEEIKVPRRELGHLILFSIALAAVWYTLVQWGVGLLLPREVYSVSELPTADAAARAWSFRGASTLLVVGGLLGIVTTWNGFFVGATRLLFGMGRARMLPAAFARIHPRYQSPSGAILFVTVCSLAAPLLGRQAVIWLADTCSLAIVVAYFLVALSFLRLRRSEPSLARPYRVQYPRLVGYGAVLTALAFITLYLPFSPSRLLWPQEWAIVFAWAGLGLVAYFYGRSVHPRLDPAEQERIVFGEYARTVGPSGPGGPAPR
jgi:amino acid transporter